MPNELDKAIYEGLLHVASLITQQADRLATDMEDDKELRKIKAELEKLAEPFHPTRQSALAAESRYEAPLCFINTAATGDDEELYPNGIDGKTGKPLLKIDAATAADIAKGNRKELDDLQTLHANKNNQGVAHLGTTGDVDQNDIKQARWAVVVRAQEDVAVLKALWPLIEHRMRQMGFSTLDFDFQSSDTSCGAWLSRHTDGGEKTLKDNWGQVPPVLLVQAKERTQVRSWLSRHKVMQAPVNPVLGVPFYLMLVGRPGPLNANDDVCIPLSFQYELDIFWGVGRLVFTDINGQHRFDDYRTYAERVVAWETRPDAASRLRKEIAFFGTSHEGDPSTQRSASELITPLHTWSKTSTFTTNLGLTQTCYLGDEATRDNLARLLSASTPPALLFTANHGIGMPISDPAQLVKLQGALVTAEYDPDAIKREHYLAGEDLDSITNTNLDGMIAFLFGCYSAGCPQNDEFIFDQNKPRRQIAPFPFIAQLPQRMLIKGALAVMGHVERAWTYSFTGTEVGASSQIQPFQDVLSRLLQGMPAGSATDQFNVIQGARSVALTEELNNLEAGMIPNLALLSRLWMARNDARNYALIGDPAVKLAI